MIYLLDTNICIYTIKKKPVSAIKAIRSKRPEEIAVSTITIAELEYGAAKSSNPDRNKAALLEFLIPFAILSFDHLAAFHYGRARMSLEAAGIPIGPMDLLLAAQAMSRNLILVTNNEKEFQKIDALRIESWASS